MRASSVLSVCLVVVVGCWCAVTCKNLDNVRTKRTTAAGLSCESLKTFLQMKNLTFDDPKSKGGICNGQCCDSDTEAVLRRQVQQDFVALLQHNPRSVQGLLSSTAETLQNHVLELAGQSENKTLDLFSKVYQGMAVLSREPISALFKDIRQYIQLNRTEGSSTILGTTGSATHSLDMKKSVSRFFEELFPLAYHRGADAPKRDFTMNYKSCLKKSIATILPFGEVPVQISESVSKSLEAARLLLEAFNTGYNVLNATESLLTDENGSSECHDALMKMNYCPKCQGLKKHVRPCAGYCLNVLRGCITKYFNGLDLPWNGYVEGVESLVNAIKKSNNDAGVNVDLVLRNLDTDISTAIMYSMEKIKEIDSKVKRSCGAAEFSKKEDPLMAENVTPLPTPSSGKPSRVVNNRVYSPLPEKKLDQFLTSIRKTKGFYGNLADTVCHDETFAEPKDKSCWNGERVAEYTKAVTDVGFDAQKYNPEMKLSTTQQNVNPKLSMLAEQLRNVHNMALSSLGSAYVESDYMQQDGSDGSGSGAGEFDDEDEDYMRGSGSGDSPLSTDAPKSDDEMSRSNIPSVTQSSSSCISSSTLSVLLVFTIIIFRND